MNENTNLTYNDFSAGQVAGGGEPSSSLSVDGDLYFDLG